MPNVLLTSVCRPFGGPGEGDSVAAELFHAQVTRAQGIFSFRQVIRCWAIDYIGYNLDAPCVALHYPSEKEFVRELLLGQYDYVGINFVVATFHKVRRMVRLIRQHSPGSKIVLGGYGTVLPDEILEPFADHICREEGITYMRRLLGEVVERPIEHPYAPIPTVRVYSFQPREIVGHLTAGLGCPNGCDFCCTSHFFRRKYVPFLRTGREIYEAISAMEQRAKDVGEELSGFIFIDEDFFLQQRRAREFLECVRQSDRPLPGLMGFGSVRGISQFTADEIAEMGFDTIWTAFEGTEAGYGKLKGKPLDELYASLKSRGISLLSSMIIGFPYQDRAQIHREFERLMTLGPSMTQILIYFAFPGTPFHNQVLAEGRYLPEYTRNPDLRRWDGFSMHFHHPHLAPSEVESIQKELYRLDFELLGPSIVRVMKVWLQGYLNLRESPEGRLRDRASRLRDSLIRAVPALKPAMLFGPTPALRREARQLERLIRAEIGSLPTSVRMRALFTPLLAMWTWLTMKLNLFQQPALFRACYRIDEDRHPSVFRLQGGFHAGAARVLGEDILENLKRVLSRLMPARKDDGFSASAVTRNLARRADHSETVSKQ